MFRLCFVLIKSEQNGHHFATCSRQSLPRLIQENKMDITSLHVHGKVDHVTSVEVR